MKRILIFLMMVAAPHLFATTWYVRPSGGTYYNATNNPTGQCDGTHDADYPGTGTNQPCAAKSPQALWADNAGVWAIAGGDTVIVRQKTAPGYRNGCDNQSCTSPSASFCVSNNLNCSMPVPPSGTSSAHTRILGENYANCTSDAAKTNMFGGWGQKWTFNLQGADYVDVQCFNLTDNANCDYASGGLMACGTAPYDDFAQEAISLGYNTTHTLLQDIFIHSYATRGMQGPTGDGFVINRLHIRGAPETGWDLDWGDGSRGSGSLTMTKLWVEFAGCLEDQITGLIEDCTDDSAGINGNGDGVGFPDTQTPALNMTCDQCQFDYNTQDGFDARHVFGPSTLTVSRSLAYGNMGNQMKNGAAGGGPNHILFSNSIAVGNCNAMRSNSIPGFAAGATSRLGDFCRGNGAAMVILVDDSYVGSNFYNNTILASYGYPNSAGMGIEMDCLTSCGTATKINIVNNTFLLYPDSVANGDPSGGNSPAATLAFVGVSPSVLSNTGSSYANNSSYWPSGGGTCPNGTYGDQNALCTTPGLNTQTWPVIGTGDYSVAANNSGVVGAGVQKAGVTDDYTGFLRPNPPSMGAYEFQAIPSINSLGGSVVIGGSVTF